MKRFVLCCALVVLAAMGAGCSDEESPAPVVDEEEDLPEEVSVVVGKQGGVVRAKGMTLNVPEGALSKDVTITAKLTGKATPKDVKVVSRVYEFGPKGTTFMKEVSLSFQMQKPEPQAKVYFTKAGTETEFEKLVTSSKDKEVSAKIRHFSLGFVGIAEDESSPEPDLDAAVEDDEDAGVEPDAGGATTIDVSAISVQSRDSYGRGVDQTWAAYRDGTDSWQLLPKPTTPGSYAFSVKQAEYAVAFVCSDSENTDSVGTVVYAKSTKQELEVAASGGCVSMAPFMYDLSGTLENLPSGAFEYRFGHEYLSSDRLALSGASASYMITDLPQALFVTPLLGFYDANGVMLQVHRFEGRVPSGLSVQDVDLSGNGQAPAKMSTLRVNNASASTQLQASLSIGRNTSALPLDWGESIFEGSARELSYMSFFSGALPADQYRFYAVEDLGETLREVELLTQTAEGIVLELPTAPSVTLGYEPATAFLPTATFVGGAGATGYTLGYGFEGGNGVRHFTLHAQAGLTLLAGLPGDLVFPDLTLAPGFKPEWAEALVSTVDVFANVLQESSTAGGSLRTRSEQREPMHLTQ